MLLLKLIKIRIFTIQDHKVSSEESDEDYSEKFQNNLKSFLDKMKKTHENMLFGMKIHRDANVDTTSIHQFHFYHIFFN